MKRYATFITEIFDTVPEMYFVSKANDMFDVYFNSDTKKIKLEIDSRSGIRTGNKAYNISFMTRDKEEKETWGGRPYQGAPRLSKDERTTTDSTKIYGMVCNAVIHFFKERVDLNPGDTIRYSTSHSVGHGVGKTQHQVYSVFAKRWCDALGMEITFQESGKFTLTKK